MDDGLNKIFYDDSVFSEKENLRIYYHTYYNCGTFINHCHSFYELNVVTKGKGKHFIGNKTYEVEPGNLFVIPPYIVHGYEFPNNNFEIFHILFKPIYFTKYNFILTNIPGYNIFFDIDPYLRLNNENTNTLFSLGKDFEELSVDFKRLNALYIAGNNNQQTVELFTNFIIANICQKINKEDTLPSKNGENLLYIMKAVEFIQKNYATKITIEVLEKVSNMSRSSFLRSFKYYYHITPLEYLNRYRIENSKRLLTTTDMNITTIAQECGYFDCSHFIKFFQKYVGSSPLKFRKNQKQK